MSVKWHNLKVILRYSEGMDQPIVTPQWPMLFDLGSDPGELYNVFADKMDMGSMLGVALKFVADYQKSIVEYPNIKTGDEFEGYPAATSAAGSSRAPDDHKPQPEMNHTSRRIRR